MTHNTENWSTIARIGYSGPLKPKIEEFMYPIFGKSYRKVHILDDQVLPHADALKMYEQSYVKFFQEHSEILRWLTSTASNVYDTDISNTESGTDYAKQETQATHIQDIAVRRAITELGKSFQGSEMINIRGKDSNGYCLNPGKIPFIHPEYILRPNRLGWWEEGSVEDFWQSNKALQIKKRSLSAHKERDSTKVPRNTYTVEKGDLEEITLLFCTFQDPHPKIKGFGKTSDDQDQEYYVEFAHPYVDGHYISEKEFYSQLDISWDLLLRAGQQLMPKTLKRIGKIVKNIKVISH